MTPKTRPLHQRAVSKSFLKENKKPWVSRQCPCWLKSRRWSGLWRLWWLCWSLPSPGWWSTWGRVCWRSGCCGGAHSGLIPWSSLGVWTWQCGHWQIFCNYWWEFKMWEAFGQGKCFGSEQHRSTVSKKKNQWLKFQLFFSIPLGVYWYIIG